jgi:hypothetical protein
MIGEPHDTKVSRAVRRDRFATTANAMSKIFGTLLLAFRGRCVVVFVCKCLLVGWYSISLVRYFSY